MISLAVFCFVLFLLLVFFPWSSAARGWLQGEGEGERGGREGVCWSKLSLYSTFLAGAILSCVGPVWLAGFGGLFSCPFFVRGGVTCDSVHCLV